MTALYEIRESRMDEAGVGSGFMIYSFLEGDQDERVASRKIFRVTTQVGLDRTSTNGNPYHPASEGPPSWTDNLYDSRGLVPVPSGRFGRVTREPAVADHHSYHSRPSHHMRNGDQELDGVDFRPDVDVLFLDSIFWKSCRRAGRGNLPSGLDFTTSQLELIQTVALEPEDFCFPELGTPGESGGLHDVFALLPNVKEILIIGVLVLQDCRLSQPGDGASGYMANSGCVARDQLEAWGFERSMGSPSRRGRAAVDETVESLWERWRQIRQMYSRPKAAMDEIPQVTKWVLAHDSSAWQRLRSTSFFGQKARSHARLCPLHCIAG